MIYTSSYNNIKSNKYITISILGNRGTRNRNNKYYIKEYLEELIKKRILK